MERICGTCHSGSIAWANVGEITTSGSPDPTAK